MHIKKKSQLKKKELAAIMAGWGQDGLPTVAFVLWLWMHMLARAEEEENSQGR